MCLLGLFFTGQKIDAWGILEISLDHSVSISFPAGLSKPRPWPPEQSLMEQVTLLHLEDHAIGLLVALCLGDGLVFLRIKRFSHSGHGFDAEPLQGG